MVPTPRSQSCRTLSYFLLDHETAVYATQKLDNADLKGHFLRASLTDANSSADRITTPRDSLRSEGGKGGLRTGTYSVAQSEIQTAGVNERGSVMTSKIIRGRLFHAPK